jgi:uncharacterized membrane protein
MSHLTVLLIGTLAYLAQLTIEPAVFAPVIVAFFAFFGSWLTYRQAKKSTHAATMIRNREIDIEAFARAKEIYEGSIEEQNARINRIGNQLKDEQDHTVTMEADMRDLRRKIVGLIRLLEANGIEIPPELQR